MGRKAKFDVQTLEIGQKLPFPRNKERFIYQYLNNFHNRLPERKFKKVVKGEKYFIERVV